MPRSVHGRRSPVCEGEVWKVSYPIIFIGESLHIVGEAPDKEFIVELAKYEPVRLADGKFTGVAVIPPEQPTSRSSSTCTEAVEPIPGIRGRVPQLPFAAALGVPGYSINRPDNLDSVSLNLPTDIDDGFYSASAEALSRLPRTSGIVIRTRRRESSCKDVQSALQSRLLSPPSGQSRTRRARPSGRCLA